MHKQSTLLNFIGNNYEYIFTNDISTSDNQIEVSQTLSTHNRIPTAPT